MQQSKTRIGNRFAKPALIAAAGLLFGASGAFAADHGAHKNKQAEAATGSTDKKTATAAPHKTADPAAQQAPAKQATVKQAAPATKQAAKATTIYNLKTKAKGAPANPFGKYWLLVAEGCISCDQVLSGVKTVCSGKKPAPGKISFFVTGENEKKMLKKLKDYAGYDVFSGSTEDMFASYGFQGAPALLAKEKGKIVSGKTGILNVLKKDAGLCPAVKTAG